MTELPDDFAEFLAQEARSAVAAIHQFLENPYQLEGYHLFVEGDDDGAFYSSHVLSNTGEIAHHYVCGGKAQVIQAYESLQVPPGSKVAFLVDRDHQDFINDRVVPEQVYVTDFYSYESYFVDERFVSRFVSDKLGLPQGNPLHASVVAGFVRSERSFATIIRPLTALILAVRSAGGKLNLNNLALDKALSLDDKGIFSVRRDYRRTACATIVVDSAGVTRADVIRWRRQLSMASRLNWVRGKYYIWCVFRYLKRIAEGLSRARRELGLKKGKIPPLLDSLPAFCASSFAPLCPPSFAAALHELGRRS
jgi:hypothetical protein